MKLLTKEEVQVIAGGNAGSTMRDVCNDNNYPDSATITYSSTEGGSLGLGGTLGSRASTTVTVTTTCGELRGGSGSIGGNQTSGDGVGPGGTIIPFSG